MQTLRRKTPLISPEAFSMKHYSSRKNNNLPAFVLVFSIFLFGCFMYNEDVKSIADFPFSSSKDGKMQEKAPNQSNPVHEINMNVVEDEKHETTVPVLKHSRTIVETEVEGYEDRRSLPLILKTSISKEEDEEDEKKEEGEKQKEEDEEDDDEEEEEGEKQKTELPAAEEEDDEVVELPPEDCDLFTGEWVIDNSTHPLYKEDQCEFLTAQVTCLRNGRRDSQYQYWKWQPRDCSLPKY